MWIGWYWDQWWYQYQWCVVTAPRRYSTHCYVTDMRTHAHTHTHPRFCQLCRSHARTIFGKSNRFLSLISVDVSHKWKFPTPWRWNFFSFDFGMSSPEMIMTAEPAPNSGCPYPGTAIERQCNEILNNITRVNMNMNRSGTNQILRQFLI